MIVNAALPQTTGSIASAGARARRSEEPEEGVSADKFDPDHPDGNPSTPLLHKAVCGAVGAGLAWNAFNIGSQIAALPGVEAKLIAGAVTLGAVAAGWVVSDFTSGIFHWAIDNYPTRHTPVLGRLAENFQIHHHDRKSILKGSTMTKIAEVGGALSVPLLGLGLWGPHYAVAAGITTLLAGNIVTQASHRWSHMNTPPKYAQKLMDLGITQSKRNHGMHHAMPWDDYYCIVNGMWNPLLSKHNFWRKLERGVFEVTGREPNSWRDPGVKAMAMGEISKEEFLAARGENRKIFREKVKDELPEFLERQARRQQGLPVD